MSPPSSCILTRQNEAIEPVASRRILLRLPPNFVLPLVAFAYNSHYISFFSLSLSLAISFILLLTAQRNSNSRRNSNNSIGRKGQQRSEKVRSASEIRKGLTTPMIALRIPRRDAVFYLKIRDVRGMPGRNVGARGTDKGDRDSRPSVPVSCLRERNKIV